MEVIDFVFLVILSSALVILFTLGNNLIEKRINKEQPRRNPTIIQVKVQEFVNELRESTKNKKVYIL